MKIIETCPKCGHDLIDIMLASNPPIPKKECWSCGWSWEGKREEIIRIPFGSNILSNIPECCRNCSNYPINGGYTVCSCSKPYMNK